MMSGHGTNDVAIEAWKLGVVDYVEKPVLIDDTFCTRKLLPVIRKAVEQARLMAEPVLLPDEVPGGGTRTEVLLGKSEPLQKVIRQIGLAAGRNDPVLIHGEP